MQRVVEGTKAEALDLEARLRLQLKRQAGIAAEPEASPARTFSSFCLNEYKAHCLRPKKGQLPTTYHRKTKYQLATLIQYFGDTLLDRLTTQQVESFTVSCTDTRDLSISYTNGLLTTFKAVLRRARKLKVPVSDPEIEMLEDDGETSAGVWTKEEIGHLLATARTVRPAIYPLLLVLANTGCRKGEALALRRMDVDAKRNRIHIRVRADWKPKNRKSRTIPVPKDLQEWANSISDASTDYAFKSSRGGRWAFFPTRQFDKVLKVANLEGSPHWFRHSYATHMVMETKDLYLVAGLLGHSHTSVTERYSHHLDEHLDRAGDAFSVGPAKDRVPAPGPEDRASPVELRVIDGGKASGS